jgi:WS/DGAT C-terminal domain
VYWRGARLDGNYPLSIPLDGQAVNIAVTNSAENLDFGLVGCRRGVPHLQRLLGHLETSLKDLERAFGLRCPRQPCRHQSRWVAIPTASTRR